MGTNKKMAGTLRRSGLGRFARLFRSVMVNSYRPDSTTCADPARSGAPSTRRPRSMLP